MPPYLNVFRALGDSTHVASKLVLIWAIHWNKSAEGVSLITQAFYAVVFVTRYLDLFWRKPSDNWYLFIFKVFYIWSSVYVVLLMLRVYPRTREREKAWRLGSYCFGGSLLLTPFVTLIFTRRAYPSEMLWNFSEILESVCVLPQLLLLRQIDVPTVINSYYLLALGSYRAFYILNWIYRFATENHFIEPVSVIFGIIQVALYFDFAWVYYSRQRIKLRGGAVVDSDDLDRGWLLRRILGRHLQSMDEDERPALDGEDDVEGGRRGSAPRRGGKWGARGISVSADEGVLDHGTKASHPSPANGGLTSVDEDDDEDDLGGFSDDRGERASRDGVLSPPGALNEERRDMNSEGEWRSNIND